jgi:hypothetical protein
MDPLEPWIDASAVRRMAERLLADSDEPEVNPGPDAGFGTEFVGFAGEPRREPAPAVTVPAAVPVAVAAAVMEPPAMVFEPAVAAPVLDSPLPPMSARGWPRILSPVVLMMQISSAPSSARCGKAALRRWWGGSGVVEVEGKKNKDKDRVLARTATA